MGSSLPIAVLVGLVILHCALLSAGDDPAQEPTSTQSPPPPPTPNADGGGARRSAAAPGPANSPKKDNTVKTGKPGTKRRMGKGYGGYNYGEEGGNYGGNHGYGHNQQYGGGYHNEGYSHNNGYGGSEHYGGGGYNNEGYGNEGYEQGGYGEENSGYGHRHHHGYGENSYGHQEYGPFSYEHGYSYDTHYCSVHGSFSLALSHDNYGYEQKDNYGKKEHGYGKKEEGYGEDKYGGDNYEKKEEYGVEGYGKGGYGKHHYKPRFHTRQYCRYAAAASERSCRFCCRVVARSSNTSPDDVIGAIFAFDPEHPTSNGAGFEHGYGGGEGYGNEGYGKKEEYGKEHSSYGKQEGGYGNNYYDRSAYQCVCCAPKHESGYGYKKK